MPLQQRLTFEVMLPSMVGVLAADVYDVRRSLFSLGRQVNWTATLHACIDMRIALKTRFIWVDYSEIERYPHLSLGPDSIYGFKLDEK